MNILVPRSPPFANQAFQDINANVPTELAEEVQTHLSRDLPDGWTLQTLTVDEVAPVAEGYKGRFRATVALEASTYALYDEFRDPDLLTRVAQEGETRQLYGTVLASERGSGWEVELALDLSALAVGETRDTFEGQTVVLGAELTNFVAEWEAQRRAEHEAALARLMEEVEARARAHRERLAGLEAEAASFREAVAAAPQAEPSEGDAEEPVAAAAAPEPVPAEASENTQEVAAPEAAPAETSAQEEGEAAQGELEAAAPAPEADPRVFGPGDRVEVVLGPLRVRDGTGLSAAVLGNQPEGVVGTILADAPQQVDGYWWWRIDFDEGPDGWSAQGSDQADFFLRLE